MFRDLAAKNNDHDDASDNGDTASIFNYIKEKNKHDRYLHVVEHLWEQIGG